MLNTFDEIIQFITKTHKEYLEALKTVKEDIRYIIELCSKVVNAIITLFDMTLEALQTGSSNKGLQLNQI